jgi:hypothetical protein
VRVPRPRAGGTYRETLLQTLNKVAVINTPSRTSSVQGLVISKCVGSRPTHLPAVHGIRCSGPHPAPLHVGALPPLPPRCTLSFTVCLPRPVQPRTTNPSVCMRPTTCPRHSPLLDTVWSQRGPTEVLCMRWWREARVLSTSDTSSRICVVPWALAVGSRHGAERGWMLCVLASTAQSGMALRLFRRAAPPCKPQRFSTIDRIPSTLGGCVGA